LSSSAGFLRWINPGSGRRQAEALVESLLPAATHFSYVVPQLDRLPVRVLPRQALVIALTPLLDQRFINAMIDLVARGFDVILLAVSPIEPTRRVLRGSLLDDMACQLWAMEWQVKLGEVRRCGVDDRGVAPGGATRCGARAAGQKPSAICGTAMNPFWVGLPIARNGGGCHSGPGSRHRSL